MLVRRVERLDRRRRRAVVVQLPIRGIFEDQNAVAQAELSGDFHQSRPAVGGERQAGGVLEVARAVDEFHAVQLAAVLDAVEQRLDRADVHAAVVHRDGHHAGAEALEGAGVDEVRRGGGDHDVAGVDQRLGDQVQRLLAAGGDDQIVRRQAHVRSGLTLGLLDVRQAALAQPGEARRGAVLQRLAGAGFVGQQVVDDAQHLLSREGEGVDQAGGEADEVGVPHRRVDQEADRLLVRPLGFGGQRQIGGGRGHVFR